MRERSDHLFRVDRERGVPVGTQLAWHIRRLIAAGRLAPGDRLPSVRQLADAAGVHVNTARSVYGRLEEQGYVSSEHGRGTFVAKDLPPTGRRERVERLAAELEAGALEAGLEPREVVAHLYGSKQPPPPTAGGAPAVDVAGSADRADPEAGARRELRREIAALEARLVRHPAAQLAEDDRRSPRPAHRGLLSADELRQVRDELVERLRRADSVRAEVIAQLRRSEAERRTASERRGSARGSPSLAGVRVRFTGGP